MRRVTILVVVLAALLGVAFWRVWPQIIKEQETKIKPVTLTVWGFGEEASFKNIFDEYQKINPLVSFSYVRESHLNYLPRLQTQINAGSSSGGPDIFMIHSSWRPILTGFLLTAPESVFNFTDYSRVFYPVAKDTLTLDKKIYGVPAELDGLALFYNDDILKAAGASVPKTWTEFVDIAKKVTVKDADGKIQTAGAALGSGENIDFWPEILQLLFLQQPGADLNSPATAAGVEVLQFYTGFIIDPQKKVWDVNLPASGKMFTDGKLAFYFAPSSEVKILKETAPNLNFGVALVPQLPGKIVSVSGFWAWAVSANSANQKEAWEFLKFLSSEKLAGIPPKVEMAQEMLKDLKLGAFVVQGPYYKGWYLNSNTQDSSLNESMIRAYQEAVNGVLQGRNPMQMLQITQASVKEILKNYKINQ